MPIDPQFILDRRSLIASPLAAAILTNTAAAGVTGGQPSIPAT